MFFVGAGKNLNEARNVLAFEEKGNKIIIISVAEHEYSIAKDDFPGANPFDAFDTIEDIRIARLAADVVIVLFHGGIERHRYPLPNLQRVCRKMVENGADYVICQHSHCIGAFEKYKHGYIVYGQGNLLFDYFDDEMWRTGLLVEITIEASGKRINFIPVVKKGATIDLADDLEKESILRTFAERSEYVYDKQAIQNRFSEFSKQRKYYYLQTFLGFGSMLRRVDNRLKNALVKVIFNKKIVPLLYIMLKCESHLEVIINILEEELPVIEGKR